MSAFRFPEDRIPVSIAFAFSLVDLGFYLWVESLWVLAVWILVGLIPKANFGAWSHHHQHCMVFKHTWLNRLLELSHFFHVGISSNAWMLHHVVGHHQHYLDQSKDESAWKDSKGRRMGRLKYVLVGVFTTYPRIWKSGLRYSKHLKIFIPMTLLSLGLLGCLFYFNWVNALMVYLIPMVLGLMLIYLATYDHHSGLDTDDPYQASYNITDPVYNFFTGNLGYHTAHHVKQSIHWSRLPEYHQTIQHRIPPELYCEAGYPFSWINTALPYFQWMRRNPT